MFNRRRKAVVKCEGRFPELREFLYEEAMPVVLEDRTAISLEDLSNMWDLVKDDVYSFDSKDRYFGNTADKLRKTSPESSLGLIPLVASPGHTFVSDGSSSHPIREYALAMGNSPKVADSLAAMTSYNRDFLRGFLKREPKTIVFPTGQNLGKYMISADVGIGTIVQGGISGGGIRSDAPFLLGIYEQTNPGEPDLASVLGFWAQDNAMLVSQMQPCKNGKLPKEVPFGVASLHLAESVAGMMGFDKIMTYCAREHPLFKEHPEDWRQLGGDFTMFYDSSAKKLGFNGGRSECHEKNLRH